MDRPFYFLYFEMRHDAKICAIIIIMKETGRIKTEREKIMTFTRRDFLMLGGIIFVTIIIMSYSLRGDVIYGSKDDWASQHYAIPEYLRTLF